MTTIAELRAWFDRNYPGRDWYGLCQAVVVNAADATGGFVGTYPSATAAYRASSIESYDAAAAPAGAVHYWSVPGNADGHDSVSLGDGIMLHGYSLLWESWGTNIGTIGVVAFNEARPSWTYLGWSYSNGANRIYIEAVEPPVPAGAKRFRNRPDGSANMRSGPGTSFGVTGQIASGDYGDFNGWTHGESVSGEDIWLRGYHSGNWAWIGSFTSTDVTGLPEIPTNQPTLPPAAEYKPADLSWIVEPTAADFPSWIRYEERIDPDELVDHLVKNKEDWAYYLDKYGIDQSYDPRQSIVHWWDAPSAGATFEGVLNGFLNTKDKSVDYITEPGRIAKTGSLLTSSYTTGQAGMGSWSSENNPIMTTDSAAAELGYRTLAYLHYIIEKLNPRLRAQAIRLHKEFVATQCSDIDPVRLRNTIEMFFDGRLDPKTGQAPGVDPEPEVPVDPNPEEPEEPHVPVPEKPDAPTPDTAVVADLVNEAATNVILPDKFRSYLWWGVLAVGAVLLGVQGWYAGIKEIPPDWFYGSVGVALVILPIMALLARANMPSKTIEAAAKASEKQKK